MSYNIRGRYIHHGIKSRVTWISLNQSSIVGHLKYCVDLDDNLDNWKSFNEDVSSYWTMIRASIL